MWMACRKTKTSYPLVTTVLQTFGVQNLAAGSMLLVFAHLIRNMPASAICWVFVSSHPPYPPVFIFIALRCKILIFCWTDFMNCCNKLLQPARVNEYVLILLLYLFHPQTLVFDFFCEALQQAQEIGQSFEFGAGLGVMLKAKCACFEPRVLLCTGILKRTWGRMTGSVPGTILLCSNSIRK